MRCESALQVDHCNITLSDSKTCNSIARIWSKLVSVTCCRRFLSQQWPDFHCFHPRLPRRKPCSVSLETNRCDKNRPSVTCLQIRAKNMRCESALQIDQRYTTFEKHDHLSSLSSFRWGVPVAPPLFETTNSQAIIVYQTVQLTIGSLSTKTGGDDYNAQNKTHNKRST